MLRATLLSGWWTSSGWPGGIISRDNLVGLRVLRSPHIRLWPWRARIPCHRWASANVPRGTRSAVGAAKSESTTCQCLDGGLWGRRLPGRNRRRRLADRALQSCSGCDMRIPALSATPPAALNPSLSGPRPVSRPPTTSEVGGVRLPMGPAFGPVFGRSASAEQVRIHPSSLSRPQPNQLQL